MPSDFLPDYGHQVVPETTPEQERDATGRWLKGVSGNPGGRPPIAKRLRELAQSKSEAMIHALERIANDEDEPAAARIAAMREILDRAVGKPTQPLSGSDDPDKPQLPSIAISFVEPGKE